MSVRVWILGSGDAFGTGGRMQSCVLLERGETAALLDCGASSLIALKRFGVDPGRVAAVAVSHFHGDHFGGLPFLLLDQRFAHRAAPLVVAGPPGIAARVRTAFDASYPGSAETIPFPVEYVELGERPGEVAWLRVRAFAADHTPGTAARVLRIEVDGVIVAYSGDTAWTDGLARAADGADLLICEALSFAKPLPHHLSHATLAEHRDALRCGRIVLTHAGPEMLARRAESAFELADDGWSIELG